MKGALQMLSQPVKSIAASVSAGVVGLLLMIGPAAAAQATGAVNVRSGPSTSYTIVDQLYRGEVVDVTQCRTTGWCYVIHAGPDGWVSRNYLTGIGGTAGPSVIIRPGITLNFSFGRGDGFSFDLGDSQVGSRTELVCLARFFRADQVAAGADANVQSARVLPRWQAEQIDGPGDRYGIFDYGTNAQTTDTCRYLDQLN
jgi:hypothetical protein